MSKHESEQDATREQFNELAPAHLYYEETLLDKLRRERDDVAAKIAVQATRVAHLRLLLTEPPNGATTPMAHATAAPTTGPRPGSKVARAHAYLVEKGDARHVREISHAIGDGDHAVTRNSLAPQLGRYASQGRLFAHDPDRGPRFFRALTRASSANSEHEDEVRGPAGPAS